MRIVTLIPSATEIVCALGLESQLVGVTHECDYPPTVRGKAVVTRSSLPPAADSAEIDRRVAAQRSQGASLYEIDPRVLGALAPELIISQTLCDVCAVDDAEVRAAVRRMTAGGAAAPRVLYLEPTTLEGVLESIGQVAAAAGVAERGVAVVRGLRHRIATVRAAAADARGASARGSHGLGERVRVGHAIAGGPPHSAGADVGVPRVVVLEWLDPPYTCGHWTPELVALAGGHEPLARPGERSRRTTYEEVAAADPDVLVIACCGFGVERTLRDIAGFLAQPAVSRLRCVRERRAFVVDGSAYFSRPGPRLVDTLEILAHAIDPAAHELPESVPAARGIGS